MCFVQKTVCPIFVESLYVNDCTLLVETVLLASSIERISEDYKLNDIGLQKRFQPITYKQCVYSEEPGAQFGPWLQHLWYNSFNVKLTRNARERYVPSLWAKLSEEN